MARKKKKKYNHLSSPKQLWQPKKLLCIVFAFLTTLFVGYYDDIVSPIHLPQDGQPIQLYASQLKDDLRKLFCHTIGTAKSSIQLYIYSLTDKQVAEALRKKQEQGVSVTVVCDEENFGKAKELLGKKIKVVKRLTEGLMHLKILIVDDETVLLGSSNLTTDSLTVHHNLVAAVTSPAFAKHLGSSLEPLVKSVTHAYPEKNFMIGDQLVEMWISPDETDHTSKRLIRLIDESKKSVRVAMFTFTHYGLSYALLRAQKRGVHVEVVMDKNQTRATNMPTAVLLSLQGIPLKISQGRPILHHKFVWIDDTVLAHGSLNWTKRAFTQNDDCFMVMHGLLPEQQKVMEALWQEVDACGIPYENECYSEAA